MLAPLLAMFAALAVFGFGVGTAFSPGGYDPAGAGSVRAESFLDRDVRAGSPDLVAVAEADGGVRTPAARRAATVLRPVRRIMRARRRGEPRRGAVLCHTWGFAAWARPAPTHSHSAQCRQGHPLLSTRKEGN
ncbi:hypothetical protein [Streptomyces sp. NBC_01187]|uniref:hypothetical protein n=1 Tax=Streptomyces sp. NBC_01187 TaxID=2903766 RepID=UPI0038638478|nr:hypothetical protein OG220_33280 [Streptomyces sp. NBC_01187]